MGGGVVRGLAHIGVLEVLVQAGIPIDVVAGTSAGAIVAVGYCSGRGLDEMHHFARRLTWWRIARPVLPKSGLVTFSGLRSLMTAEFGEVDLRDLPVPCVVATTDIDRGEPVYLNTGPATLAVQASCSVPGFVAPVAWEGRRLCEGGIVDMLPVNPLRRMGVDYVIGVDIFVFKLRRFLGPLGYGLGGIEIALERAGGGLGSADCLIAPDLSGMTYLRFSRREALIERGRQAARKMLPVLCRDLGIEPPAELLPFGEPPTGEPSPNDLQSAGLGLAAETSS